MSSAHSLGRLVGFGAVTLLCCRLPCFLFPLGGHYRNDGYVKMRCALVHVTRDAPTTLSLPNVSRAHFMLSAIHSSSLPLSMIFCIPSLSEVITMLRAAHLPVGDFSGYPALAMRYSTAAASPVIPSGYSTRLVAVEMRPRRVCVVGMGAALDMLGYRVQRRVRLDDVEHCVAHRRTSLSCGAIGVYGFLLSRSGD